MNFIMYIVSSMVLMLMMIALIPALLKRDEFSFKLFLICVVFQNILGILFSPYCTSLYIQILILYKEMILYGVICINCMCHFNHKIRINNLYMLLYLILLFIFTIFTSVSLYARLVSLRQLLQPIILVYFGYSLSLSEDALQKLVNLVIKVGVCIAIFGFIEEFILGDQFWLSLNISEYYEVRGFETGIHSHGLPGNYYSADFYSMLGRNFRRLVSILADPLLTSHFLAFSFVLLLYGNATGINKLKRKAYLFILGIAVLLALSKGAILIVGVAIYFYIRDRYRGLSYIVLILCFMLLTVILKKNIFDSLQIHIDGLVSSVRLIGTGLGTAGNYAIWNSGKEITDAGESYWGAIMAQVGGVALCLFIMAFVRIFRIIGNKTQSILSKTVVAYIIASLIESMLSESAISYVGNGLAFVFLGIIYRRSLNISKKEMKI